MTTPMTMLMLRDVDELFAKQHDCRTSATMTEQNGQEETNTMKTLHPTSTSVVHATAICHRCHHYRRERQKMCPTRTRRQLIEHAAAWRLLMMMMTMITVVVALSSLPLLQQQRQHQRPESEPLQTADRRRSERVQILVVRQPSHDNCIARMNQHDTKLTTDSHRCHQRTILHMLMVILLVVCYLQQQPHHHRLHQQRE